MRWISDMSNKEIGEEIERLCKLGDLQLPELPKETAELLKDDFGRWEDKVIRLSFDNWIRGNSRINAYAKANANFLCKVVKEYIEVYRHKLKTKPKAYVETPTPVVVVKSPEEQKRDDFDAIRKCKVMWDMVVVRGEGGQYLSYPYLMLNYTIAEKYDLLPKSYSQQHLDKVIEQYKAYRHRMDMLSLRSAVNEVKRASIQKIIEQAASHNLEWRKIGLLGIYFSTKN